MDGHHHHHVYGQAAESRVLVFSIALNMLYVVVEAAVGLHEGSLSLLSDAGHNLGDVFALALVLVSFRLCKIHPTKRFTYGLKKSTVLISLANALLLTVAVAAIIIEAVRKCRCPVDVNGAAVSWTALVGIIVNGLTVILLTWGQKKDLNIRGAFLHMLADTLVSAGVVISGIAISLTGISLIDPLVSLAIAAVIIVSTWKLLRESVTLALDGTPEGVDVDDIERTIRQCRGVKDVHHLHIWAISTTVNALTAHVLITDTDTLDETKSEIRRRLAEKGIAHVTIEMETHSCGCAECV